MRGLHRASAKRDELPPGSTATAEEPDPADEPCRHPSTTPCEGALEWECTTCGFAQPRLPEQRDGRWDQRLAAAHTFQEKYERRNALAARRRRREAALGAPRGLRWPT